MDEATLKRVIATAVNEACDTIASKVIERLMKNPPPFWVGGETHYNHHQRLCRWFRFWDMGLRSIGLVALGCAAVGLLYLVSLGFGFKY